MGNCQVRFREKGGWNSLHLLDNNFKGMKQIFYSIIILLFFTLEVHSSFTDTLHFRVSTAYKELLANPSEITEANFFQAFPDNCNEFVIWKWQFDNSKERKMMNIEEYIERLGQLVTIKDSIYCLKLIHLSIGANYDSDGLSFFQHILRDKMQNPKLFSIFIDLLSRPTWTKGEQLRFWMFYWSSLSFQRKRKRIGVQSWISYWSVWSIIKIWGKLFVWLMSILHIRCFSSAVIICMDISIWTI